MRLPPRISVSVQREASSSSRPAAGYKRTRRSGRGWERDGDTWGTTPKAVEILVGPNASEASPVSLVLRIPACAGSLSQTARDALKFRFRDYAQRGACAERDICLSASTVKGGSVPVLATCYIAPYGARRPDYPRHGQISRTLCARTTTSLRRGCFQSGKPVSL